MATFDTAQKARLIYVFAIADEQHHGCLKVGETTLEEDSDGILSPNSEPLNKAAHKRIDQYTKTAGIAYELLYTEMTIFISGGQVKSFNDKQVHDILVRSGIKRKTFSAVKGANEWFCCGLSTVKKAIEAAKSGRMSINSTDVTTQVEPIVLRPEQREAVDKTKRRFLKSNRMLWNAKMRFGKTLCALSVVKEMSMHRTIIVTHRPVVDQSWFDDFYKVFADCPNYHYGSKNKGETFATLEKLAAKGDNYVYFASVQDMRGSVLVGGKFDKNYDVFATPWDCLIVDEAHEGTKTELGKAVVDGLTSQDTKVLQLSGTPFNLLDDYSEDEIFTWDYVMEQKAKTEWDMLHMGDHNPYEGLPQINIYTYDLGMLISEYADEDVAFNFREFFRTKDDGSFVHDKDVSHFLDMLCDDSQDSLYPFANDNFRKIFRHTLWVLPGVKSARALSSKLQSHPVFSGFHVVNVAGNGDEDEENADALKMVNDAIGPDPDETYTITLSCGRLTTGVSVKPWTAVFMMAGSFSTSTASYMQTIFRVQTPFTHKGRMKQQCYAFDFAPDRTLRVLADVAKVSAKAGKTSSEDRMVLGDFLNYCPIISIDGSKMKPYDVNSMMAQLKKAQIEKVVQCGFEDGALYNDELLKLTDVDLQEFNNLRGIIGKTKALGKTGDIDINQQGFTQEEYDEIEIIERKPKRKRTPEEEQRLAELKERHGQRKEAISILRGISIRMPLLIYGAELNDEDEDITIDNFADLIDDQSWEEFMPRSVTKEVFSRFKKYYEPDIFREAGKRIRAMARAADKFTIEQRIERIAAIFSTFRNPDKETVLTPWRVVNMHLSDCLGGYCFYDETFTHTLETPRFVDHQGVTAEVFRPDSRIMEVNSKSGLYPLYAAYSIYRSRVDAVRSKYGEIGHAFSLSLWDNTIEQNLLVVCKTPMARSITRRTLVGFRDTRVNAVYYKDLIKNIAENLVAVVNTLRDGKRFWKINNDVTMTIDALIGNPPYQVNVGEKKDNYGVLIFNKFVDLATSIAPSYISLIFPSRWFTGGRGLDDFRARMLKDHRIRFIKDFVDATECFPTADIAGDINYILWDKHHDGQCDFVSTWHGHTSRMLRKLDEFETFIRRNEALTIVHKALALGERRMQESVSGQTPFGFITTFRGRQQHFANAIRLYGSNGSVSYVAPEEVARHKEWVDKYKVIFTMAAPGGGGSDRNGQYLLLSSSKVIAPGEVCTQTFLVGCVFENETEAVNCLGYLRTRFVRFLILQTMTSQHLSPDKFRFVPLQDFTKPWTDETLYAKYGLTEEEIAYVERLIKPIPSI